MPENEFKHWMWFQALDNLSRAQGLHRQFFLLRQEREQPAWEPPADVLETEAEVLVFFALPGVDAADVEAAIENGTLIVSGRRVYPKELQTALIHRLELPQGHFERRVPLPAGRYDAVERQSQNGCLVVRLHKLGR